MNTHDSYALASDWAKVCEAADVDTDATAEEVIEGFALDALTFDEAREMACVLSARGEFADGITVESIWARGAVCGALAAVARVRAIHQREVIAVHPGIGEEAWCPACQEHWPCSTVAALDGAPEPEWEDVVQYGNLTSAGFLQEIRGRNYAMHKRVVRFGPVLPAQGESDE